MGTNKSVLDLHKVIDSAYTDEELQALAKEKARAAINVGLEKALDSVFSSYNSPFGKAMEEKLKESVSIAIDKIKVPEFAVLIAEAIGDAINKDCSEFQKQAVDKYTEIVKGRYQKKYKMSELVLAMMDCLAEDAIDQWYLRGKTKLGKVTIEETHTEDYSGKDRGYPGFVKVTLTGIDSYLASTESVHVEFHVKGRKNSKNSKPSDGTPFSVDIYKTSRAVEKVSLRNFNELSKLELFLFHLKTRGFEITEFDRENYPDGFYTSDYGRNGSRLDIINSEWPDPCSLAYGELFEEEYIDTGDEYD